MDLTEPVTDYLRPRRNSRSAVAMVLAASMTVSACATTNGGLGGTAGNGSEDFCRKDNPRLTDADRQMCEDAATTFNETVAGGVLAGALAGAAVGALIGLASGDGRAVARGAIGGAIAGGVLGGVDGYMTAKAQEAGNNKVMMITSMTRDVTERNAKLKKLVDSSQQSLKTSQIQLTKLEADVRAKRASKEDLDEAHRSNAYKQEALNKWIENAKKERDNYVEASRRMTSSGQSTEDLDKQIHQMTANIKKLEKIASSVNTAQKVHRS